jgi:hypothetical protein
MIIVFFLLILSLNKLLLTSVSSVFPDFEIIIKRHFFKSIFFLVFEFFAGLSCRKKKNFFLFFQHKKNI